MADESLTSLLARLDREQQEADRAYNEALTALDRVQGPPPDLPHPPPTYDDSQITPLNETWNILPDGPPVAGQSGGGLKARLRAFVWRVVGPPLEGQRQFNAALVDHFNRNVAAHREAEKAITSTIALARQQAESMARLHAHLIRYLQTITLYVDTKDRAVGGQAQVLNAGLGAVADDWLKRWETLGAREARFAARHETLAGTYAETRDLAALAQQSALTLKREVERLIAQGLGAPSPGGAAVDLESFKYVGFEDRFRGSRDEIRTRLADYLPHFAGQGEVLDLGCGRGEFLELLAANGIAARGLDLNHEMVEVGRSKGLAVTEIDALGGLAALPDESLGGIFAAQVAEHLEPAYLMRLIETAQHKLRPGGVIILETINPACWVAFFESYIRDLTHVRPLHPETLQYLLRVSGFKEVHVEYRAPVDADARLQPVADAAQDTAPVLAGLIDTFNANVDKLNGRMFGHQDYAAIGRK